MTRRRWLLAAILAAVVTVVWVVPVVAGPEVDCGEVRRETCEHLAALVVRHQRIPFPLPVTRIAIEDDCGPEVGVIERWFIRSEYVIFDLCSPQT